MNNVTVSPNGVIISYEAWNSYWKEMADEFEKLKKDFKYLQDDKSVTIRLDIRSYSLDSADRFREKYISIGAIEPSVQVGNEVPFEIDARLLKKRVYELIDDDSGGRSWQKFYSLQDITEQINEHNQTVRKIEDFTREYKKYQKEALDYVKSLPFIIRWLFRLKINKNEK